MIYKVLSNLQTGAGTFVAGDEIEMDEETAKHLVEDGILEAICPEKPEESETPEASLEGEEELNLDKLEMKELKKMAEEKGMDITGLRKKVALIKAIVRFEPKETEGEGTEGEESSTD